MSKFFIPPIFFLLSIVITIILYFSLPHYNKISYPINLIGIIVSISGLMMMGNSRQLFKKHKTTLKIKESSGLITEGIYSKSRNPMYIGMFILSSGISISSTNVIAVVSPLICIFIIRVFFIPKEEALMENTFGKDYLVYKKQVRRWI